MANHFEGEFHAERKREEVYDFLTDPIQNDREFTVNVRVGISHIRGTASVQLQLAEAERPKRALYQGRGSVAGGTVNLTASFELTDNGQGTRVRWKADAQLFGRLISLAGGLLEPLAKKNVQKLIDGLQTALT